MEGLSKRFAVVGASVSVAMLVACLAPDVPRGPRIAGGGHDEHELAMSLPPALSQPIALRMPARAADRVVVVSIDGLRPDALEPDATPALARLEREGVAARNGRTIDRSSTLPSHASMLTGVNVETHGIGWNAWRPTLGRVRYPSIFHVANVAGLATSLVVAKRKLEHVVGEGDADVFQTGGLSCDRVNQIALPELRDALPGIHFVHYGDVDSAGHSDGWMSHRYLAAVRRVDRCVGELVEGLVARGDVERTLLLVTSDHGGHGRSHGTSEPIDTGIPWIAWGGPVRSDAHVGDVDTRDTAATALAALGLPMPDGIEGRPVDGIWR
jgi:hypothetical protein